MWACLKPYTTKNNNKGREIHVLNMLNFKCIDILSAGWNFNSGNYLFTTDTK